MGSRSPRPSASAFRADGGSVLVLVLWSITLFAVFSVTLAGIASSRASAAKAVRGRMVGRALAGAAVADFRVVSLEKKTAKDQLALLIDEKKGEAGEGRYVCRAGDESAKIDLNHAGLAVLAALPGVDSTLATRIVEGRPYRTLRQLSAVNGLDPELFEKLSPYLTVFTDGAVNVNTASDTVLRALGFSDNLIATIRDIRTGPDGRAGTEDDVLFESADQILNQLRDRSMVFEADQALILERAGEKGLGVHAAAYRLDIEAVLRDQVVGRYRVWVGEGRILAWEE